MIKAKRGPKGQTTVEYMLLLLVVMGLAVTFMGRAREFILGNSQECNAQNRSMICNFERAYNFGDMRYYQIRR